MNFIFRVVRCDSSPVAVCGIARLRSNTFVSICDDTFQCAMRFGLCFSFGFSHFPQTRRPVFRCVVRGANAKYFDFFKPFEPANGSVTAHQLGFRNRCSLPPPTLICRFAFRRVKKCQSKERASFRFSTEAYQLSKQTSCGLNPRSKASSGISAK